MAGFSNFKALIVAEPEAIEVNLSRTAIIVVDMQNAFVRKGAYLDLAGYDVSATEKIIAPCSKILRLVREKGIEIIYLQMVRDRNWTNRKMEDSPSIRKTRIPVLIKKHPDLENKAYFDGTWGAQIIRELKPEKDDSVLKKQTYDGFIDTDLDSKLSGLGARYLIFVGTATNICVESTIRHAFFLGYFPILVSDAVSQMGPNITQQATILNVQSTFGWVTTTERLLRAIR
jgi:ureidoacrylate peracid hydrolase